MNVLGISYSGDHDTACALVQDGKLLFAVSEERYSRKTHDSAFPSQAIRHTLQFAKLRPSDIDAVCIGWSNPWVQFAFDMKLNIRRGYKGLFRKVLKSGHHVWLKGGFKRYEQEFGKGKFIFCDHHLAHAISSYAYSGFSEATVVVVDGKGAFEATSVWHARDGKIKLIEVIRFPNSLGLLYAKFTKYLGFKPLSDEWKVMGLAAYGKDGIRMNDFIDLSANPYKVNDNTLLGNGMSDVSKMESILGRRREEDAEPIDDLYKDIAFAVQKNTEQAVLRIVEQAVQKTGCRTLCLAGGVILNCKANGKIANSGLIDQLFIQPASSDEGAALGAAMYPFYLSEGKLPSFKMEHAYWGPQFTPDEIKTFLDNCKIPYQYLDQPEKVLANIIAQGNIVGLFHGRMEFGPRALGNRSILADPRRPEMKDKVNYSVKYREWWRPFAPSILEEMYHDFFETKFLSPFMILSFPLKEGWKSRIPAAMHLDNTARPQSVNKRDNPFYWKIIDEFYKITGVPALLNTSFNLKGEPIVASPEQAVRTFYSSGLDYLFIENFVISKKQTAINNA